VWAKIWIREDGKVETVEIQKRSGNKFTKISSVRVPYGRSHSVSDLFWLRLVRFGDIRLLCLRRDGRKQIEPTGGFCAPLPGKPEHLALAFFPISKTI
jgi:hypothetical protein